MKRLLALLLAVLTICSLASCSILLNSDEQPSEKPSQEEKLPAFDFTEVTVMDNDQCTVKVIGIENNTLFGGITLKVQVENKSAEKDYTFDLDKAFINGLQYDLYMSVDVAPGKKAIEEIDVFGSYLERMKSEGCEQLSDIELCFAVHEMDNFDDEHMMSGSAHVYPYGKDQAMAFDRPSLSSDVVLVDNDYLTILYIGDKTDSDREYGEYTVELFIVSKSDKDLKVDLSEEYINDFLIPSYADISIAAGRSRYASVSWSLRALDDAGVSEVSSIECIFGVQEDDFWAYEDLATEKVTITP